LYKATQPRQPPHTPGLWSNYQKKTDKVIEFFFCNNDIERYVKGTKRR
jgi:hypothetical protein